MSKANEELKLNRSVHEHEDSKETIDKEKEIERLQAELAAEKAHKEKLLIDAQKKFKEERDHMERLIEGNVDKKNVLDLEGKI